MKSKFFRFAPHPSSILHGTMGVASSVPPAACVYGEQGELGPLLCVAFSASRVAGGGSGPNVLSVARGAVDLYHAVSGDRRMRLVAPHDGALTAAAFLDDTIIGPTVALGSAAGAVHLVSAATLTVGRTLVTSGDAASTASSMSAVTRPRLGSGLDLPPGAPTAPAAAAAAGGALRSAVTAVAWRSATSLLVGHADGSTRAFSVSSGALEAVFNLPAGATPLTAVTAVASCATPSGAALVAVGHGDGTVVLHDARDERDGADAALVIGTALKGLSQLLALPSLGCVAALAQGTNQLVLLDLSSGRSVTLDFGAELHSVGRSYSRLSAAVWDDTRGVLLCGADDGAVYVRSVRRIAETADFAVRLVRVAKPAQSARAPAKITALGGLSRADALVTGGEDGLVRRVVKVTGKDSPSSPGK